jgi:hypothetical protein
MKFKVSLRDSEGIQMAQDRFCKRTNVILFRIKGGNILANNLV